MEGCIGVVSRWFSRFRAAKFKKISGQVEKREQDVTSDDKCSTDLLNGGDSPCMDPQNHQSGCPTEPSFNMGVGCYLLYLIAASKTEHDKMMELRTQMEMLLQDAKKELEAKDTLADPFKFTSVFPNSTIDVREGVESSYDHSLHNSKTSYVLPVSPTIMMCDQSSDCDTPKSEQCPKGMDPLEAELEAELERFLLQHPQQQSIEVTFNDTDTAKSQSFSSGEVINPEIDPQEEECTEVDYGIPPYELERRLHEVLEGRQQEQITELEAALECARHKLCEKDIEITWWKDTAKLLSQHIPANSRPIS
ncbi:protein POLAR LOCALIZATION DURING ASYMMETRIC DIVISION AND REDISTRIBUTION-like [Pistacia vera]|uniref:protein POLAR LOCALIZATION DURING ASYMMETRIC DIVISION AND REDISTRIBUTION-like n=1 Tax=Pistacia vera TaxID=55513 RepID=UPI001262CEFE|nr:protein POLAR LOCALIZATION DURING ASYMMETRIC DIVISION AND REDISTRIBUTION-like [Pistacia vera]